MSSSGKRSLPLGDFVLGNRQTDRAADELLVAIHVPRRAEGSRSHFVKLGARRYLVISIVSMALRLDIDDSGRIAGAGVAVGACSAVPQRLPALEAARDDRSPAVRRAVQWAIGAIDDRR